MLGRRYIKNALLVLCLSAVLSGCTPRDASNQPAATSLARKRPIQIVQFSTQPLETIPTATIPPGTTLPPAAATPIPPTPICTSQDKVVVYILVDTSASMLENNKIGKLKTAVTYFTQLLDDDTIVGMQRYSSDTNILLTVAPMRDHRGVINNLIQGLTADGSTFMLDAFKLFASERNTIRSQYFYSDHRWVLVFLSDGVYESIVDGQTGKVLVNQDPTEVANAVKNAGVRLITIGLEMDVPRGRQLMRDLASSPQDAHENVTGDQLKAIYEQIAHAICS